MYPKFLPSLLTTISVGCLLPGCQLYAPTSGLPTFGSLAQITSISPDTTQVLHVGEHVKLKVDVSYVLNAESGTIELVVLAEDNSEIAQDTAAITRGSGQSTLGAQFTVPITATVRVFTPMTAMGQNATSATDGRAYKVIPQ
ncbi:MAG: hypothetical protein ACYC4S_00925 [Rhodoferax sp.]